jgi:hypothetical protein
MDIIKYLSKESINLGAKGKFRLEELGVVNPLGSPVMTISKDSRASDAFSLMVEVLVTSVPVHYLRKGSPLWL